MSISTRILILLIACLAGYLSASGRAADEKIGGTYGQKPQSGASPSVQKPARTAAPATVNCERPAVADPLSRSDEVFRPVPAHGLPETGLPARFDRMVKPRSREPQTLPEWYAAFQEEERDAEWASSVEARISDVIFAAGVNGLQAEYVSCRKSRCTVAGYVDPTAGFDSCSVSGWIGQARIFSRSFGSTCKDEEIAGLQRFVVLIDSERPL